jgi:hypothetical protein
MTKRILLFLSFCTIVSTVAWAQQSCILSNGSFSNKLACQIPVITTAATPGTIGNPAAVFSSSFAVQLGQLPILSSGSGVIFNLDKSTGLPIASENLGPILTERAETIGKHKLLVAFAYQHFNFTSIDGTDLSAVPFVFAAQTGTVTIPDKNQPCTGTGSIICLSQTDHINMSINQYTALATFGINAKTDISVIIPFEQVSQNVAAHGTQYFINSNPPVSATFTSAAPGSANGIGDMLVGVKRMLWSGENARLAAGILVRFPTGDALNYLGSGAYGFDPYGSFSYNYKRISPHARLGYQFNTSTVLSPNVNGSGNSNLPGGFQYAFGADAIVFKKVPTTFAADYLGNYIRNAPVLVLGTPVQVQGFSVPDQPTLRPQVGSYNSSQLSLGFKVKPYKSLMFYGNVLLQLNNVGLRSAPVPLAGVSYTFH